MNFDLTPLATSAGLVSLFTLILLEIVLGIDNVIFIAIISGKLPPAQQKNARIIGLTLALVARIILLTTITWMTKAIEPIFYIKDFGVSGRDIILFLGGVFLIIKTFKEILEKFRKADDMHYKKAKLTLGEAILQITLIDIVFSFDSILTAVGLSREIAIMIIAVTISMLVMLAFAPFVSEFINKYPTIKMLALVFLIAIGILLLSESLHLDTHHLKNYAYVAMAFSLTVELLNIRLRIVHSRKNF
ncbi:MAG: TerC family protein [Bacteroidetes bacterium]|nr:TerC family protein [Bacteroidota bacterium]